MEEIQETGELHAGALTTSMILIAILAGCSKMFSESFDDAQDERRRFDILNVVPFMLRHSKHS